LVENEKILAEAVALIASATDMGLTLRLLGGIAVRATCPSSTKPPFARACEDMDFFAEGKASGISAVFSSRGWKSDAEFNLYNGESRLIFRSCDECIKADVFLGIFQMCHEIPFQGRTRRDPLALPLAELLLTKLQVVQANRKDLADAACILVDHPVGDCDGERINSRAFASACAGDWGLWKTTGISLARLRDWTVAEEGLGNDERDRILGRIAELGTAMESRPKTMKWKTRSIIGDRMRWYDLPEEVDR
jgi:hypothetical protein